MQRPVSARSGADGSTRAELTADLSVDDGASADAACEGYLPVSASKRWLALCEAARDPLRTLYDFPDYYIPLLKATPYRIAEYARLLVSSDGDGLRASSRPTAEASRQRSLLPLPYRALEGSDFFPS